MNFLFEKNKSVSPQNVGLNYKIISGSSSTKLTEDVCKYLGTDVCKSTKTRFKNNEIFTRIDESIRNKEVFIIQTGCNMKDYSINDLIMEVMLLIDSCKRANAKNINLILPHLPYSRQDKLDERRTPVSSRIIADMFQKNVNRLFAIDLHAPQIQGFFTIPVENLTSLPLVKSYLTDNIFSEDKKERYDKYIIVSPDLGGTKRASKFSNALKTDCATMNKQRSEANKVEKMIMLCENNTIEGKIAIICDDMCDTGGTILECAKVLTEKGKAKEVICVVTHGIFSDNALEKINKCDYLKKMIVSDSIPQEENLKTCFKLEVFTISNLIGEVIKRTINGSSISSYCN